MQTSGFEEVYKKKIETLYLKASLETLCLKFDISVTSKNGNYSGQRVR